MMTNKTQTPGQSEAKILVELSLMPAQQKALKEFLDAHFEELLTENPETEKKLQQAIRKNFPKAIIEELGKVLSGQSEYALLIRNTPERPGFEKSRDSFEEKETYSYHIGKALYTMCGARQTMVERLTRNSHKENPRKPNGSINIHRDYIPAEDSVNVKDDRARYIILSSPYNAEHATTEVVNLKRALNGIPKEKRAGITVNALIRDKNNISHIAPKNLDQVLEAMSDTTPWVEGALKGLVIKDQDAATLDPALQQALAENSRAVDLQPGDLLVINEDTMFHRGNAGNPKHIANIPKDMILSRIIMHNAGGPVR